MTGVTMIIATASSTAGIATAIEAGIGVVTGFIVALTALIPLLRRAKRTETVASEIKTIVNGHSANQAAHIADLTDALNTAGVPVPRDRSLPPVSDGGVHSEASAPPH